MLTECYRARRRNRQLSLSAAIMSSPRQNLFPIPWESFNLRCNFLSLVCSIYIMLSGAKSIVFRWRRTDRRMRTWQSSLDHTSQCSQVRWASVTWLSSKATCPGATAPCSTCRDTCRWIGSARARCRGHELTTWTRVWTHQTGTRGTRPVSRTEASSPCPGTRPGPGPGTRTASEIGGNVS